MAREVGQIIIAGIPVMLKTGFRLGIAYLRFKKRVQTAARVFERELLAGGIDRISARKLTEMYLESSRIVHMGIKGAVGGRGARRRPAKEPAGPAARGDY